MRLRHRGAQQCDHSSRRVTPPRPRPLRAHSLTLFSQSQLLPSQLLAFQQRGSRSLLSLTVAPTSRHHPCPHAVPDDSSPLLVPPCASLHTCGPSANPVAANRGPDQPSPPVPSRGARRLAATPRPTVCLPPHVWSISDFPCCSSCCRHYPSRDDTSTTLSVAMVWSTWPHHDGLLPPCHCSALAFALYKHPPPPNSTTLTASIPLCF